jgi:hypothetical protein
MKVAPTFSIGYNKTNIAEVELVKVLTEIVMAEDWDGQ